MKTMVLIKASFLAVFLFATQAYAFVLPAPVALKLMAKHLGEAESLFVNQRVLLFGNENENGKIELAETLSYRFPRSFRSHIHFKNNHRILVVVSGKSLSILNGKVQPISQTRFDRYKDLLLYRSPDIVKKNLNDLGVDTTVSSLGHFENKVVLVIGAKYPDKSVSQLWIEKDTFLPCRWILKQGINSEVLDIIYEKWEQRQSLWYPMKIKFYQQNELIREIYVEELIAGARFSPDLFDISRLESKYGSKTMEDKTPDKSDEPDEVQKTIEDFKRLYK